MAEQLSLEDLPFVVYRAALKRALDAGVPRQWLAELVGALHVWAPNPPLSFLERELELLAHRAGVDLAEAGSTAPPSPVS